MLTKKIFILFALVVIQLGSNDAKPYEPYKPDEVLLEKDYVMENVVKANFFEAIRTCLKRQMRLATITSEAENKQIIQLIKNSGPANQKHSYWTSGTDLGSEGNFYWMSSGEPVTYSDWSLNNPNNYLQPWHEYENCLEIWNNDGAEYYAWNDNACSQKNYFICERFNEILD